ncbi:fatty acid--CoA ligase, partial [Streptomyces sp. CA-250714]
MHSTMQDVPLLLSRILTHGATVHGGSQITTWTGDAEPHRTTFRATGERAAQLAHALADLGVGEGDVLGTLMW